MNFWVRHDTASPRFENKAARRTAGPSIQFGACRNLFAAIGDDPKARTPSLDGLGAVLGSVSRPLACSRGV